MATATAVKRARAKVVSFIFAMVELTGCALSAGWWSGVVKMLLLLMRRGEKRSKDGQKLPFYNRVVCLQRSHFFSLSLSPWKSQDGMKDCIKAALSLEVSHDVCRVRF